MRVFSREKFLLVLEAVRESFVAIIPFIILSSLLILVVSIITVTGNSTVIGLVTNLPGEIFSFFSFVLLISLAYHVARAFSQDPIISVLLAMSVFITIELLSFNHQYTSHFFDSTSARILSLICPIISVIVLNYCTQISKLKHSYKGLNQQVGMTVSYILPFILSYCFTVVFMIVTILAFNYMFDDFTDYLIIESPDLFLIFRSLFVHISWFFGIHGSNLFDTLFSLELLKIDIFDNLSYRSFYETYGFYGGAGSGLSLIAAILLYSKDKHARQIAIAALPFAIFNINEVLIFGLPIVLNRYLIIPFVLAPIASVALSYLVLSLGFIQFSGQASPWITPIFINSYMMTDGNILSLILQASGLVLTTALYIPFIKKYTSIQSSTEQLRKLEDTLNLTTSLNTKQGFLFNQTQQAIIESHNEIEKIIRMITQHQLTVYYQPKIDIISDSCDHVEALLRIELEDGSIVGPYFLDDIEQAGLALVIDKWVCQRVKEDIERWAKLSYTPKVSVNLHPDTIRDHDTTRDISRLLSGFDVEIEIIERAFINNEQAIENIHYLKGKGFKIALDDFGTGYASLHALSVVPIDTVKIDKSIVDLINNEKGFCINKNVTALCRDLKLDCVAEGVESIDQLMLVKRVGAKYVQGWYFSKALTANQVIPFMQGSSDLMKKIQYKHNSAGDLYSEQTSPLDPVTATAAT